jgi:hypothetical protein
MHQLQPTDANAPSVLTCHPLFTGHRQNPILGAATFLKEHKFDVDIVACPGDLSDRADAVAQREAWTQLEGLRKKLHASRLIGTVGNHDVDSRRADASNLPDATLRNLVPRFPLNDRRLAAQFWSKQYTILKLPNHDATIVILNSSALHGVVPGKEQGPEHLHGKLTEASLSALADDLKGSLSSVNVLMMHHHIRKHPWLTGDASHATNGTMALELLRNTGVQWFVIHGHQHLPSIGYAEGGALSPIILSAGSIAAKTYSVRGKTPRNQMYCVEFETERTGASLTGRIFAWDWIPFAGWQKSTRESGLPRECGFGSRDTDGVARRLVALLQTASDKRMSWLDASTAVPEIAHLTPEDLDVVVGQLEHSQVEIAYDRWQVPSQFQLR